MFHKVPFATGLDGPIQAYSRDNFVPTPTGNRISPVGHKIIGLSSIMVLGKTIIEPNVTMRGDIAKINIGSYCIVCENSVLKPADQIADTNQPFAPLQIGDHTVVGRSCTIRANSIGSYCYISENCVVGQRCIVESCTMLEPNTVLAPGTAVPPFCVYGGNPGRKVGTLSPSFKYQMEDHTKTYYKKFLSERRVREFQQQNQSN